ncbi:hemerythrin domain-containing protein [Curvibacter sp. APW13]|uniref:hemerythrin domain-containing protein n=1 Tax=Curvibacter sp. APW13 TaxID=3077236 RepID=UPI0028DD5596|nr:hemerythrin domain-containing protein [Curvibacter sp. APW13]MDT8989346.1 hemerythrin domain-containing protein [Curvibacter sp. APW13]
MTIQDFMAGDHRFCDSFYASAQDAVQAQQWDEALAQFGRFTGLVHQHFCAEEHVLFPAFEEATGMTQGPTQVMRHEHEQLRQLMQAAIDALRSRDADEFDGHAETLFLMLQQHNAKEEGVLYPMCDQRLGAQHGAVHEQLQARIPPSLE